MSKPKAKDWDTHLAVVDYDLVVFLLGSRYLDAIEPPIAASAGQRILFLAKPAENPDSGT